MLHFQIAGAPGGSLLEHLIQESIGATSGGGIFAWANVGGVRSLLEDPVFDAFLTRGAFGLVVGTDTITDTRAAERLAMLADRRPGLTAQAFLSPTTSLFHPKLAWFEHPTHLSLVVGSGNLTMGGLRSNWEAFVVERPSGDEREEAHAQIEDLLAELDENLYPIDDPRVLSRVARNVGNEQMLRRGRGRLPSRPLRAEHDRVLLAEIPRASSRWSQANFDRSNYQGFFGAKVGSQRRIALYHVDGLGIVGELESRPSVEVASQNYRFELAAARGVPYPVAAPPIGVFVRLATQQFLYSLLLPGEAGYAEVDGLLSVQWAGPRREKRRISTDVGALQAAWPACPLLRAAPPAL